MRKRNRHGGLLLEVLLALSLVTLTVVTISGVLPFSYNASRSAWRFSTAQRLLASEIETLRGEKFEDIATRVNMRTIDGTPFRVETAVSDFETTPKVKRKLVDTRVIWESKKGTETLSRQTVLVHFRRV